MLKILSTLARVGLGFVLASLTAGLVTVLFVNTPMEMAAQPVGQYAETASETLDLALLAATHAAIFAAAFVLISAGFGEWLSIRSLPFYLIMGCAISLAGLAAQYSSEVPGQPTILNNYAVQAFFTAGFFAGFMYWLASGQFAGAPAGSRSGDVHREDVTADMAEGTAARSQRRDKREHERRAEEAEDADAVIIERPKRHPLTYAKAGRTRLMERLAAARERIASARAARSEAAAAAAAAREEEAATAVAKDAASDDKGKDAPARPKSARPENDDA